MSASSTRQGRRAFNAERRVQIPPRTQMPPPTEFGTEATNFGSRCSTHLGGTAADSPSGKARSCNLRNPRFDSAIGLHERDQGVGRGTPACQVGGAGAAPAGRSIHAPLSERLGPCLPSKRGAFDSLTVLQRRRLAGLGGSGARGRATETRPRAEHVLPKRRW